MSNKQTITTFIADESDRLTRSLEDMLANPLPPTDAEKDALLSDMEETLTKLQNALNYLTANIAELEQDKEEIPVA